MLPAYVYCDLLQNALDMPDMLWHPQPSERVALAATRAKQGSDKMGPPERMTELSDLATHKDDTLKALGIILEAWEEGADNGVAPELMAYAALYAALTDLVAAYGEDNVSEMARGLAKRVTAGEFTLYNTKQ